MVFSPIMEVSSQRTKRQGFYTHYFMRFKNIVWFQDISSWNWSFEDYPYKNNCLLNFIDSCIKSFLNNLYTPKVPKRNAFVKLPLLGITSFQIRKKLQKLFSNKLTSCNLKIIFTSPVSVKSFLPKMLLSGFSYKYKCGACNATYYGITKQDFKVRIWEYLGISHLTGRNGKDWQQQTNNDPGTPLML